VRLNQLKQAGFTPQPGRLWHTDTVIIWRYGERRMILTAIEDQTKLGYARNGETCQREYLLGAAASSVLGYVGEGEGEITGKDGLELVYNDRLKGL
jgi:hypothetical protein